MESSAGPANVMSVKSEKQSYPGEQPNDSNSQLFNNERIPDLSRQRIFKIIVIGDSNVGKTCLTFRFCEGRFPDKTEATIGVDFREKNVQIGGDILKLQIWDTAGQERFRRSMVQHYYRNAHAVVFVYDVTRMQTFENLSLWMEECHINGVSNDVPKIVVGNKCDALEKQVVSISLAQRFADGRHMPLFETSAKDNSKADHVESIFMTLAHKLHSCKPMAFTVTCSSDDTKRLSQSVASPAYPNNDSTNACWC